MAETIDLPPLPEIWSRPPRGRVLLVAPHPDDETLGAGGTLRHHVMQGDPVRILVLTAGLAGDPGGSRTPEGLRATRERESREAAGVLGVSDVVFWGLPDGRQISTEDLRVLIPPLREAIRDYAPDLVYCPWEGECHVDHFSTFLLCRGAVTECGPGTRLLGYEVWNPSLPDVIVDISETHDVKRRALACHRSQTTHTDLDRAISGLNAHRALFLPRGASYGEAFVRVAG